MLRSLITTATTQNRLFENPKYLLAFQCFIFGFMLISLIELAVTASVQNQWATEMTFPSRFSAIIGMLGLLVFLTSLQILVFKKTSPIKQHTAYIFLAICAFLFYYQEIVILSSNQSRTGSVEMFYEIILYKPLLISFCPVPLLQFILVIGDTILITTQWECIQNTKAISVCILNVLIPFVIAWLPGKIQKNHPRFNSESSSPSMDEAVDWIDELLNGLPDGVIVFKDDGAVKYYNDSIISLLESKEENFLAELIKLPNKDLISEMLAEDHLPELTPNHHSAPLKKKLSIFKDDTPTKNDSSLILSPDLKSSKSKPFAKHLEVPNSNLGLTNLSLAHISSDTPKSVHKSFRKLNTLQGSEASPKMHKMTRRGSDERKAGWNKHLQDNPKEFLKRKQLTMGENLGSPDFPLTGRSARLQQNISVLVENSMQNLSGIEEELFDHERIAQDQAVKLVPKNEAAKRQILNGEKRSKHSTVGDAILSILRQLNQKETQRVSGTPEELPHLMPSHSYTHGQKITISKQTLRKKRNSTIGQFVNLQSDKDDQSEDTFTGEMCMDSLLKIGSDQIRYLALTFTSVKVKDQTYLLVSIKDTTNQDIASRLRELDKKKNQMLAMVSHEYRSPLNGIVGMLEILSEKVKTELDQKYIKPALGSAKRLLGLVNDILDFHQLENQKLKFNYEPCVLKDVVKSAMSIVELAIKNRGLEFTLTIDQGIPKTIVTDTNRLQQIILNLLSNALKFTMTGGIYVYVKPVEGGRVKFEIADTGIGIKEENISNLFKEFGKIDLGTKTSMNKQGVGLGLQISDALAKKLSLNPEGGGLRVKSEYGLGTTFSFIIDDFSKVQEENFFYADEELAEWVHTARKAGRAQEVKVFESTSNNLITEGLPLKNLGEESVKIEINSPIQIRKQSKQVRISLNLCSDCAQFLIVDDDEFNQLMLKNLLETMGITKVDTARNGNEAINKVNEKAKSNCHNKYKLIFMDCEMPIMNGYDTAKKLNEMIEMEIIPAQHIIGITGHVGKDYLEKCLQSGMNEVMTKPLNKKDFTNRVKQLLAGK